MPLFYECVNCNRDCPFNLCILRYKRVYHCKVIGILQYKSVHHHEVACASSHDEEVKDLMASEILMLAVKERKLQRIDHSADRIDYSAGKEPSESCQGHGIQDLGKCKYAGPSHSDIQNRRYPLRTVYPKSFDQDTYNGNAPYNAEKENPGLSAKYEEADGSVASCDQYADHHMVNLLQQGVDLLGFVKGVISCTRRI